MPGIRRGVHWNPAMPSRARGSRFVKRRRRVAGPLVRVLSPHCGVHFAATWSSLLPPHTLFGRTIMSVNRSSLSRPIVWLVFSGLALVGVTTFWGQNTAPQNARQPGAAGTTQAAAGQAGTAQAQPQNANP